MTLDGETVTTFNDSPSADNIYFVYQEDVFVNGVRVHQAGERAAHGLQTNDLIVYNVTAVDGKTPLAIGGLTPGQTYAVIKIDDYSIQLKHSKSLSGNVTLIKSASGDMIVRSSGNWASDGFVNGESIQITGAFSGTFTIGSASLNGTTLTLSTATPLPQATSVTATFTFTRAANTNAGSHDTIVRSSGSWTSDGFVTGQVITVTGANAGTYTLTGVTATDLQIAPQTFPSGFTASGNATVRRPNVTIAIDEQSHIALTPAKSPNISIQGDLIRNAAGGDQIIRSSGDALTTLVAGQPITIAGVTGSFTISTVSGNTITLTQNKVLPKATKVTLPFTFTRSGSAVTGNDTIVRADAGGSWVADGFTVGMQIVVTTTNAGTYSLVGVSATTLTLAPQSLPSVFNASGSATVARPTVSILIEDTRNDTHSIVKAADVPIGGLVDGQTYYIANYDGAAKTFKLATTQTDALNTSGPRITLTPTTVTGGTGLHRIGTQGIDLGSIASNSELRIQINSDTVVGTQKITGPGGASLSLTATPPGDGLSSAKAKGSGGAVFTLGSNSSNVTASPSVTAYVGNGAFISVDHSVSISSTSSTNLSAWARNGSGGLIAIGRADATVNQSGNTSNAYVDSNARIIAVEDFTLAASSNNKASASGEAYAAGGIGVAQGNGTTTIKYTTSASLNQDSRCPGRRLRQRLSEHDGQRIGDRLRRRQGLRRRRPREWDDEHRHVDRLAGDDDGHARHGRVTDRDPHAGRRDGVLGRGKRVGQGIRCWLLRRRLRERDRELLGDQHGHPLQRRAGDRLRGRRPDRQLLERPHRRLRLRPRDWPLRLRRVAWRQHDDPGQHGERQHEHDQPRARHRRAARRRSERCTTSRTRPAPAPRGSRSSSIRPTDSTPTATPRSTSTVTPTSAVGPSPPAIRTPAGQARKRRRSRGARRT